MQKTLIILSSIMLFMQAFLFTYPSTNPTNSPLLRQQSESFAACNQAAPGYAHCLSLVLTPPFSQPHLARNWPVGLTPDDLQAAYRLPSLVRGRGQLVAIVNAYDHPNAESDLAIYRTAFGLPPCTSANGCFRKVDQTGGTAYPHPDTGWAREISLDLDMVSAVCPNCSLLLVEAKSNSFGDLGKAVNTAVRLGAKVVSNSYGGNETLFEALFYAHYYQHAGVALTASAGDSGYGVQLPAAFKSVTAVGGTSLRRANTARGWEETVWQSTGSGCSKFIFKPKWQSVSSCRTRAVADVAVVADPTTGVAVFDSYGDATGWQIMGGTSVGAPIIAGIYALAGNATRIDNSYLYQHANQFNDVLVGNNGRCDLVQSCNAQMGYDGPTGLGTPNGIGAF